MNIAFNPHYKLKHDIGRTLLLPIDTTRTVESVINNVFDGFIHPIHAMILSFAKGNDKDEIIRNASKFLDIEDKFVRDFIEPLINNKNPYGVRYKNLTIRFPENTLIESDNYIGKIYNPEDFLFDKLDLKLKRHATPTRITLMINNKCATNCFYCYADRQHKMDCQISFDRISELIDESIKLNVVSVDVSGGEYLLYKYWKELLLKLLEKGFKPFISTKVPINEEDVRFLKKINSIDLQVSLDTLIPDHLINILGVNYNYIEQLKNTLALLNKYNIKTYIHTILNSINDSVEDMSSIYEFIKDFTNINYWRIDFVGPSLYLNKDFNEYKYNTKKIQGIKEFLINKSKESNFEIKHNSIVLETENPTLEDKSRKFNQRAICTGNYSNLFILPDGKVTICEELYWHPNFIIGDITKQSIEEVWNSDKAKNLFNLPQKDIPIDSVCADCEQYESCRDIIGVCWKDVIKTYGSEKWYYPDENCPKAQMINKI